MSNITLEDVKTLRIRFAYSLVIAFLLGALVALLVVKATI